MEVQFTVNLVELKRAVRRLLTRLPDESEAGDDSIVFSASGNDLEIVVGRTSEVLGPPSCIQARQEFRIMSFEASREVYSSMAEGPSPLWYRPRR
jgi:hypothetical protein